MKKGQSGFTLIELLVVVAILGVLAAIAIPNVARFIGTGTVEAANTELHNTQTAVVAYMADNNLTDIDGTIGSPGGNLNESVGIFLLGVDGIQALYTVENGEITDAIPLPDGKWKDLDFTKGAWAKKS